MATWYIDFEAYHFDNKFIVKEIAIVNEDASKCFNYFVKNPCKMPERPNTLSCYYQFKRHNLRWTFGDYNFFEAIYDIQLKINSNDKVYAKGTEKSLFLQKWLPQLKESVWISPPFKKLNMCHNELCELKHGIFCARRKVHELRFADKLFQQGILQ